MSSNTTSNVQFPPRSERRVAFHNPEITCVQSTSRTDTEKILTPLEAALNVSLEYIATLHIGLTTFLSDLVEKCLKEYAVFFYAHEKNRGMRLNNAPVPTSVKKIKLTLLPLDEVRASEDFMALHTELAAETEALHRKWADKYTIIVDTWNCNALHRRFHLSTCKTLRNAAAAFIAQLGVTDYSEDEAVIDCLAMLTHDNILSTPLPLETSTFLHLYKEANGLHWLPAPTITRNSSTLSTAIDAINKLGNTTIAATDTTDVPPIVHGGGNTGTTVSSLSNSARTQSTSHATNGNAPPVEQGTNLEECPHPEATTDKATTALPQALGDTATLLGTPSPDGAPPNVTPGASVQDDSIDSPPPPPPLQEETRGSSSSSTNTRVEGTPILYNGKPSGYNKQTHSLPRVQPQHQRPQGQMPRFDYSPLSAIGNSAHPFSPFLQGDDGDPAPSFAVNDLDIATKMANRRSIRSMLYKLFINAIKKPIAEFHAFITQREELNRIRQVTAKIPLESLATKVAAKIHSERSADRPVMAGLIREETNKALTSLKRQFQSVTDQIETNTRKLNALQNAKRNNSEESQSSTSRNRHSKKRQGGNHSWSRTPQSQSSTAAAVNSSTTPRQQTPTTTRVQHNSLSGSTNVPGIRRNDSLGVDANATAAHRRWRNKQQQRSTLSGKGNNKKQK